MPGLAETLLALSLVFGSHELGHELAADRLNVPLSFNNRMLYTPHTNNPEKLSRIANAGLAGQETLSRVASDTKMGKSIRLVSTLNKLGYALLPNGIQGGKGDLRLLEENRGKKARRVAQSALLASAAAHLLGSDKLRFSQTSRGTPMLVFSKRF